MYRVLIVEDDIRIAEGMKERLIQWDYDVQIVEDFRNVMQAFTQYMPQLVLLDITLPFYDGYHWCSEIRSVSRTPIIFISSATDRMNMIMAMNMGADDFIAKPFEKFAEKIKGADFNTAYDKAAKVTSTTLGVGAGAASAYDEAVHPETQKMHDEVDDEEVNNDKKEFDDEVQRHLDELDGEDE